MARPEALLAEFADKLKGKPEHAELRAIFKFVVTGAGGGVWRLDFKGGARVLPGEGAADLTLTMGVTELESLVKGRAKGRQLTRDGKVKWEGDREQLRRLGQLMNTL
jgi:ubiquinone biosynthesis protein UbiJ